MIASNEPGSPCCKTCRCWKEHPRTAQNLGQELGGTCKGGTPTPIVMAAPNGSPQVVGSAWPVTGPRDYCHQYEGALNLLIEERG